MVRSALSAGQERPAHDVAFQIMAAISHASWLGEFGFWLSHFRDRNSGHYWKWTCALHLWKVLYKNFMDINIVFVVTNTVSFQE